MEEIVLINDVLDKSKNEILKELNSSENGLSQDEANLRIHKFGPNIIKKQNNSVFFKILFHQIKNSLFYILFVAAILSYFLGDKNQTYIIFAILFINIFLGFFEEYRSEKIVEKLQKYLVHDVVTLRGNAKILIPETMLVPGDIISLKEGDIVPVDVRLISAVDLLVDESQLTGESIPQEKIVINPKSPKETLLFAGSIISQGEGEGVIYETAANSEYGKIAKLSSGITKTTEYEKGLQQFSSLLVKIVLTCLLATFVLKLLIFGVSGNFIETTLFVVALAIAVVPEALPVIATVTLSLGALRLAKNHVIVKSLAAAEDFGNVTVLCTDKTGTLTENKMTVTKINTENKNLFTKIALSTIQSLPGLKKHNSFDQAIIDYFSYVTTNDKVELLKEVPFDPAARRSRVAINLNNETYLVSIGSVETLIQISSCPEKDKYLEIVRRDGCDGLRHYGFAYKKIAYSDSIDLIKEETDLQFLGFFTLEDRLRDHAVSTVKLAENLGVAIKILSGDSPEVTGFIAKQVGLLKEDEKVLTGDEIEKMSDDDLERIVNTNSAFARVNPEQKYRIIRLLKNNNIVAYQGDGINDAPALKLANVSVAVNSATDIAKDSSDIVLLRKDIGVIINGVKYGRIIFANINKYIRYTMVDNFGDFIALAILFLFATNLPMSPIQILLISLITDLPLIAISGDNVPKSDILKPSHYNMKSLMKTSMSLSIVNTIFILIFFIMSKTFAPNIAQTSLFLFMVTAQLMVIFSVRTKDHLWRGTKLSSTLTIAIGLSFITTLLFIYLPSIAKLFSFTKLPILNIGIIILVAILYIFILDEVKVWLQAKSSN